ncbi:MAG TPA: FAD-dependent oxidoreductase [Nitrospira sp.]|jgi:ferredoxin-NADP reductase|nr:FAD-dependent oxidoreductase [Nitrospira sp.]
MVEQIQSATVLSATDLTPRVRQLVVLPRAQPLAFKPGQWVSLKLPVGNRPPLNRAYSMAAPSTTSGELTLIFDRVTDGLGSSYLFEVKAGDDLVLSGPYGNFVLPPSIDRELLFIARYTGLVPIRCMLKELYARPFHGSVFLLAVAPAEDELLFHHELLSLAVTHASFRYLPLVAANGEQQAVDLALPMLAPLLENNEKVLPMLCGTKGFVRALRSRFVDAGYERKQVKTETYD